MRLGSRSFSALALPLLLAAHGPSLVVSERGGPERVEVRAPHASERIVHARAYFGPDVAPTGRILLAKYAGLSGDRMKLVVTDGDTTRLLAETSSCVTTTAIARDGSMVTYADPGTGDLECNLPTTVRLVHLDPDGGAETVTELPAPPHAGWFDTGPVFSPDGTYVSLIGRQRGKDVLWLYDTATGSRLRTLTRYRPTDLPTDDGIVVRPTSQSGQGVRCRLFDLTTTESPLTCWNPDLRLDKPAAEGITASPDGTTLAWIDGRDIVLAPVGDTERRRVLGSAHTGPGTPTPTWISGRYVLTQSPEEDARSLRRVSDGHRLRWTLPTGIYGWTR